MSSVRRVIFGPNPNLLPETSETFEAGANFKFDNVLRNGDGFLAKVSYYETKIDNFITTAVGQYPQAGTYPDVGLQTPFVRVNLLGPTTTNLARGFGCGRPSLTRADSAIDRSAAEA